MSSKIDGAPRELIDRAILAIEHGTLLMSEAVDLADELRALIAAPVVERQVSVWEGAMPESNGKSNFTVILHTGDITEGICVYRSEYPDRARYEADCFRHLIGDPAFTEKPFICDYDADKHSGYVKPYTAPPELAELQATIAQLTADRDSERTLRRNHAARIYELSDALKGGQGEPVLFVNPSAINALKSGEISTVSVMRESRKFFCQPLYASQPAPVSADLAHDRAYRNGMMAGFQFGISGNEKGYARAVANFNSEIQAEKTEKPAPVSVVPAEIHKQLIGMRQQFECANFVSLGKLLTACLDRVKELNQ